jgi:putative acetyltransferase
MDVQICPISPKDTEQVLDVYRRAIFGISFPEYGGDILKELASRSSEEFACLAKTRERFVAWAGNKIVGYTGLDKAKAILTECYVAPEAKGKHIGTLLVKKVEAEARKAGINKLSVLASLNAVGFYKSNGFIESKESVLRMGNGLSMRCLLMEKRLTDSKD